MDFQNSLLDLRKAIEKNEIDLISEILSKNLDLLNHPDSRDVKRLLLSKVTNSKDYNKIMEIILNLPDFNKFGQDINLGQYLNRAILKGNLRLVEFLLMKGVKLDDLSASRYVFYRTNLESRKKMLKLLIQYGFNTKIVNEQGQNLLYQFIQNFSQKTDHDNVKIANILIDSGISVNDADDFGSTVLIRSIYNGNFKLISFLIQKGAEVNKTSDSDNFPLYAAIAKNNKAIFDLLLSKGADINARNNVGWSALHLACCQHKVEMLSLLIQNGAKISPVDHEGRTPFFQLNPENENYKRCQIVMLKEFARLTFENLFVSEYDMALIQADPNARRHFRNCLIELNRMANTQFYSPYSYYCMMKESINKNQLANLMNNEQLFSKFEEYLRTLSYFGDDLRRVSRGPIEIRDRYNTVVSRLFSIFEKYLPKLVIEILAKYLSVEELPLQ